VRGLVFDCDGVLVDSEKLSCGAWLPVLARRGIRVELAEIEQFIGKSDRAVLEYVNRRFSASLDEGVVAERLQEYYSQARGKLQTFAGIHEALRILAGRGDKLAVASSGSFEKIRFALGRARLEASFPVICSAIEVAHGKPAPDLFLLAARRLELPPLRCAVIEDSVYGIQAARAAGMAALGFTSTTSAQALRDAGATDVFGEYSQLPSVVERLGP
jgi:HAD superfamily hydrolase (TIGR01509 family)